MKKLNQKGMSLVGVLIAVAIMAGLSVAALKLMELLNKSNKNAIHNLDITSAADEMKVLLANIDSCNESLKGYNVVSESEFKIKNKAGEDKYHAGKQISPGVSISKLYIQRPSTLTDPYRGALNVVVIAKKKFAEHGKVKGASAKRVLKVIATVKGGIIDNCLSYETEAIESSVKRSCKSTGGTFDLINGECDYTKIDEGKFKDAIKMTSLEQMCNFFQGTYTAGVNGQPGSCYMSNLPPNFKNAVLFDVCNSLGGNLVGGKCLNIKTKN